MQYTIIDKTCYILYINKHRNIYICVYLCVNIIYINIFYTTKLGEGGRNKEI